MSVNPLDLQTNFMHIDTVSRREVLSKEQENLRQEHVAEHLKKEGNKSLEDVNEPHNIDRFEPLDHNQSDKNKKDNQEKKESELSKEEEETVVKQEKVLVKDIGTNLDLLG